MTLLHVDLMLHKYIYISVMCYELLKYNRSDLIIL